MSDFPAMSDYELPWPDYHREAAIKWHEPIVWTQEWLERITATK